MANVGLDIYIPYTGDPDSTLPWADDDDGLLTPGSLLLFEPNHSANPISGMPALNADMPNIAYKRAIDMLGSATFVGSITTTTLTVTNKTAGTIKPGQTLATTGGVTAATGILSQLTTTEGDSSLGGKGTYSLTTSQTVAGGTSMATIVPDSVALSLTRGGSVDTASQLVTERSSKGGIHAIISQTNNTVNSIGFVAKGKTAVHNWLMGNADHSYYMSVWDRVTRVATSGGPPQYYAGSPAFNGLFLSNYDGAGASLVTTSLGTFLDPNSGFNVTGNRFHAMAESAHAGTITAWEAVVALVGLYGAYGAAGTYGNKSASRITYRAYIEDLTISGRTYAQVQAADYAAYLAAFATGGRYNGDTYTAPAI